MQLPAPAAILGCGTFGGIGGARQLIGKGLSEAAAGETLDEAVRLGILWWDTAERYADGASERVIGTWLSSRPRELADTIHIATKVAPASLTGNRDQRFDRKYIESRIEASLRRLGRRSIALYLSHAPCDVTPVEEVVEGFAAILESGRAQRVGCCNVDPAGLTAALAAADRLGVPGFEWVQNSFSLMDPHADRELRAICRERGIVYSPYSPLAGGILSGKYRRGEEFPPDSRMALRPDGRNLSERTHGALDALRSIAGARNASCAAIALAWIMRHPDCAAPVVGPRRDAPHLAHVREALAVELSDYERTELEEAFSAAAVE
jgi:aryl-alcohol dehydrogenase-like predicted oxidoreductase